VNDAGLDLHKPHLRLVSEHFEMGLIGHSRAATHTPPLFYVLPGMLASDGRLLIDTQAAEVAAEPWPPTDQRSTGPAHDIGTSWVLTTYHDHSALADQADPRYAGLMARPFTGDIHAPSR